MTGRTGRRTPLTAYQAHGLAGAYADLVFGTFAPEFIADVAAAFFHEEVRQKDAAIEVAEQAIEKAHVALAQAENRRTVVHGKCTKDTAEHLIRRQNADRFVRRRERELARAKDHLRDMTTEDSDSHCIALRDNPVSSDSVQMMHLQACAQAPKPAMTTEPVGASALTPDGSSSNTVEEGKQMYREAKARIATACAATELVDDVRNFPRCPHHLDDARCTRREHEGDHEISEGDLVVVWPGASAEPAAEEAVCGESIRLRGVAHTCERTQGHLGPHFAPTEGSGDEEARLAEVLRNPPASEPAQAEWQSLDAVPADVRKVRDNGDDEYRRRKSGGWKFRPQGARHWTKLYLPAADYDTYAPFVAVAEGKA